MITISTIDFLMNIYNSHFRVINKVLKAMHHLNQNDNCLQCLCVPFTKNELPPMKFTNFCKMGKNNINRLALKNKIRDECLSQVSFIFEMFKSVPRQMILYIYYNLLMFV